MITAHFQDPLSATSEKVAEVIASGRTPVVQARAAPGSDVLAHMNALSGEFGSDVQIRFFGWECKEFDAAILRNVPDVANLRLDTLRVIKNVEVVGQLPKLVRLSFAVHEHPDGQFLNSLPLNRLAYLGLGENKRRNFDLTPLTAAISLQGLFVQGHDRGIDAISALPLLHDVSLSGFPKRRDLSFLNDLAPLRSLMLILGSRESIAEFTHPQLRSLKLIWVRLLENLGPLSRFGKLEKLTIEDQLRLTSIDIGGLNLRRLRIANCKNLASLQPLESIARLERFYFSQTKLPAEYQQYIRLPER